MDLKQQILTASWLTCGILLFIFFIVKYKREGGVTIGDLAIALLAFISGWIGFFAMIVYYVIEWDGWDNFWNKKLF